MEADWRSVVRDEFETLAASLWSSRIAKELEKRDFLTPKQIEDIQSTESSFAQGKQIVDIILKSESEEAFRIFCDCITESGCGDFLAQELRSSECERVILDSHSIGLLGRRKYTLVEK